MSENSIRLTQYSLELVAAVKFPQSVGNHPAQ